MTDRLLTRQDLKAFGIAVTSRTLQRLCQSGQFVAPVKLGGQNRWRESDVKRWIKNAPATKMAAA